MPLSYRDPNTNQLVSSPKTVKVKEQVQRLASSLEDAKLLQKQAIEGIDANSISNEEAEMAIIELFEGRESDKLAVEEANEKALAAEKELVLARKEIEGLRSNQEDMMQAILEIYETGAVGSE